MKMLTRFFYFCIVFLLVVFGNSLVAQVPVSEEPRHPPVLQNKYIRLLDVRLTAGDTTLYHIHSTPSVFVVLSSAVTGTQIKGEDWTKSLSSAGTIWYRSFSPDILVHRVANLDTVTYHVNDIEILASYNSIKTTRQGLLPFEILFENEKVAGYQITKAGGSKQIIKDRGPILAALISGDSVYFYDTTTKQTKKITAGGHLYIAPETSFYFSGSGTGEIKMAFFEIK